MSSPPENTIFLNNSSPTLYTRRLTDTQPSALHVHYEANGLNLRLSALCRDERHTTRVPLQASRKAPRCESKSSAPGRFMTRPSRFVRGAVTRSLTSVLTT